MKRKHFTLSFVLTSLLLAISSCNPSTNVNSSSESSSINESSSISENSSISESSSVVESSTFSEESISYIENDNEIIDLNLPSLSIDRMIYYKTNDINVSVSSTLSSLDWVGIYKENDEPGSVDALTWQYVSSTKKLSFEASTLPNFGFYSIYLCKNNGYDVYDKKTFYLKDVTDNTNYRVRNATFSSFNENNIFTSSLTIYPSSLKELTYIIYWTKDEEMLEDYSAIKMIKVKDQESFTIDFNTCMYAPLEANGIAIMVLEGRSSPLILDIDDTIKRYPSNYQYSFNVITDLHVSTYFQNFNAHLKMALLDIASNASNSKGIFTVGDNVNKTSEDEYKLLNQFVNENTFSYSPKIYYTLGNHDYMYLSSFDTAINQFKQYTQMENAYYSVTINDNHFIVLGSDSLKGEGEMSDEQLSFLENKLKEINKDEYVFIFLHQPLKNTVSGSLYDEMGQIWYGFTNQDEKIRSLISPYKNAILFTGHTHWSLNSYKPVLFGNKQTNSFVNCASVGYLWSDDDKQIEGSEGIYVDVYEDYLLIKGREFSDKQWISNAMFLFPKS